MVIPANEFIRTKPNKVEAFESVYKLIHCTDAYTKKHHGSLDVIASPLS